MEDREKMKDGRSREDGGGAVMGRKKRGRGN